MKLSRINLAKAIVATSEDIAGRIKDYDDFPHWKKLHYLCEADKFIKAVKWIRENKKDHV